MRRFIACLVNISVFTFITVLISCTNPIVYNVYLNLPPNAVLKATPPNPDLNDVVVFSDSSTDTNGVIKSRMLKFGSGDWVSWSGKDTTVNAPGVVGVWLCSLKVIDDDSEIAYSSVTIYVGGIPGMAAIPGGTFVMGSTTGKDDEMPVHSVTVSSFLMDTTEVTQKQFIDVMNAGYSNFLAPSWISTYGVGDNIPVYLVNWHSAVLYCNARTRADGRYDTVYSYTSILRIPGNNCELIGLRMDLSKKGYRLPTEAEWEYACRGGTTTDNYWGNDTNSIGDYAWYYGNSGNQIHPVAQKLPNAYGLYDMIGNVYEWCNDWYAPYSSDPVSNPTGPSNIPVPIRVVRGGYFGQKVISLRSTIRYFNSLGVVGYNCGFRVVYPH